MRELGNVKCNPNTREMWYNDVLIDKPWEVFRLYAIMCTYEYLRDNYDGTDDELWHISVDIRNDMWDYGLTESEAIIKALDDEDNNLKMKGVEKHA